MSYIDTFDHEYLGVLGYLPIYHPLVSVAGGHSEDDFSCAPSDLVLGGGGGEHPGLVVRHLECSVACFLLEFVSEDDESGIDPNAVRWLQDALCESRTAALNFFGWSIRDMARLLEMAKSDLHSSPLREDQSVEDWILTSIGEFVFYSLADLNPVPLEILAAFTSIARPIVNNVRCQPPGYPCEFGRRVVDGGLKWGVSRWRTEC